MTEDSETNSDLEKSISVSEGTMLKDNYLQLANAELDAGNLDEALRHFSSALTLDPMLAKAWIGKGYATCRRCLRSDVKLPNEFLELMEQSLIYFDKGIVLAQDNEILDLRAYSAEQVTEIASKAHADLFELLRETGSLSEFIHKPISNACINAVEWALAKEPGNTAIMKAIVVMCWRDIFGFDYEKFGPWRNSNVHYAIDEDDETLRRRAISKYVPIIRKTDSEFKSPPLLKSSQNTEIDERCFVVTACCGSESNEVRVLRGFRDEILLKSTVGQLAVAIYYTVSPSIASWMKTRKTARILVRYICIVPIVYVVSNSTQRNQLSH